VSHETFIGGRVIEAFGRKRTEGKGGEGEHWSEAGRGPEEKKKGGGARGAEDARSSSI